MPAVRVMNESRGIGWALELDRDDLLPGRIATGTLRLSINRDVETRGLIASLVATEHWQHRETYSNGQGGTSTRTVTTRDVIAREPVQVFGPATLTKGETREIKMEIPVPPLGPATLDSKVSGVTWEIDAKVDLPGGLDSGLVVPVRVLQPTALLRAGVVHAGEFALYPAADAVTDGARASLSLDPMPLCLGAPFTGSLAIETDKPLDLQEVRLELRVHVKATVSSGLEEDVVLWTGRLTGPGEFGGASHIFQVVGDLPLRDLPTIELPHGRTDAAFHVILARAWKRDPHLVRDVSICSTTEL
jgi:hypothetical protein